MNESFEVIRALKKEKTLGLSFAGTKDNIVGMAVAAGTKGYYFPVINFITKDLLTGFLMNWQPPARQCMYLMQSSSFII